jgi:hypothetical protein
LLQVANGIEEALIRFLIGTGFRIGEAAVAQWRDVEWKDKTISVRFKPELGFKPKDYEERIIAVSDTLLACPKEYRGSSPEHALVFPSPTTGTVDKHLDRFSWLFDRVARSICFENARDAGYATKVILISTEDPNLNVGRILIRMTLGGQSVPLSTIPDSYEESVTSLPAARKHPLREG